MKSIVSHGSRIRSVVLMAIIAVMVVVCGVLAVSPQQPMTAAAASPQWWYAFGTSGGLNGNASGDKTGSSYYQYVTVTKPATNYTHVTPTGSDLDSYFYVHSGSFSPTLNASTSKYAVIRYRTDDLDLDLQLWTWSGNNYANTIMLNAIGDGRWHDMYLDLNSLMNAGTGATSSGTSINYSGTMNWIRIDQDNFTSGKYFDISFIAFFDTEANMKSWAGSTVTFQAASSGTTTTPESHSGQVGTSTSTAETKVIKWGSTNPMTDSGSGATSGFYVMTNSSRPTNNTGSEFTYGWTLWIYEKVANSTSQTYKIVSGIGAGTAKTWTLGTNQIGLMYYGGGNVVTTAIGQGQYVKFSSAANNATITVYTGYTAPSSSSYNIAGVYAPTIAAANYTFIKGTVDVTGGSANTTDYTGATSVRRFYRSNMSQYLDFNGNTTTMSFSYTGLSAAGTVTLAEQTPISTAETSGFYTGGVSLYYADQSDPTIPNDDDGPIQWTYLPHGGSGTVNFQGKTTVSGGSSYDTPSYGTYYDQDVHTKGYDHGTSGETWVYSWLGGELNSGVDRYAYTGDFSHNVLPASKYVARVEYDILYNQYVKCTVQRSKVPTTNAIWDGLNIRRWNNINVQGDSALDADGIITSIPEGTEIYLGYTTRDVGNLFRICTVILDGIFYEGWIDVNTANGFTDYEAQVKAGNIYSTQTVYNNKNWAEFVKIPRIYHNIAYGESTYGVWEPLSFISDTSDMFEVRWSWTFDSEQNVFDYSKNVHPFVSSQNSNENLTFGTIDNQRISGMYDPYMNYFYGAQVEYNTGNYLTLTSDGLTRTKDFPVGFGFAHIFTQSTRFTSNGTTVTGTSTPSAYGLCKVNYLDPFNIHNNNDRYFAIVYRSQDSGNVTFMPDGTNASTAKNQMMISFTEISSQLPNNAGYVYKTADYDGEWHYLTFNLMEGYNWADGWPFIKTEDKNKYDGMARGELAAVYVFPFGNPNQDTSIDAGLSIDIGMLGIYSTESEAANFCQKYIDKLNGNLTGSVKVISTTGGSVTLNTSGSGTKKDASLLTGVAAGGSYSITVDPDEGYYCSSLYWRPTGFELIGQRESTLSQWPKYSAGYSLYNSFSVASGTSYKISSSGAKPVATTYGAGGYNSYTATSGAGKIFEKVDLLGQNYFNRFSGTTTKESTWISDTFGDNVIMNKAQIQAYNDKLVENYASSTRADRMIDITDVSKLKALTAADIVAMMNALRSSATVGTQTLTTAFNNRNTGAVQPGTSAKLGVVTTRTTLKSLPTTTEVRESPGGGDTLIETGLEYATPVWVLHTDSTDSWYFVQSYNYVGWAPKSAIAVTTLSDTDYYKWSLFAEPGVNLDILLIKVRTANIMQGTTTMGTAEMGVTLPLKSSDSTYHYLKIPTRDSNGNLVVADGYTAVANGHVGYMQYTWNNVVYQAFKYYGQTYSWGGETAGLVDCSSFVNNIMKCFGLKMMRNTSQQGLTGYTNIMNGVDYTPSNVTFETLSKFTGTPTIVMISGHVMLYLGYNNGSHYIIDSTTADGVNKVVVRTLPASYTIQHYVVMAPNNYLEDSPFATTNIDRASKTFSVTLKTPASGDDSATLNNGVKATTMRTGAYASSYILNCGGRDVYIYATFSKIQSETALDVELNNPYYAEGFYLKGGVLYGGLTLSSDHQDEAITSAGASGSKYPARVTAYKGYKLVTINGNTSYSSSDSEYVQDDAMAPSKINGNVSSTTTHAGVSVQTSGTGSSYVLRKNTDGSLVYTFEPIKYNIVYNSNFPSGSGKTAATVTGSHVWDAINNGINSTAAFTTSGSGYMKFNKDYTFSCDGYTFMGWSTSSTGVAKYKNGTTYSNQGNMISDGKEGSNVNLYAVWVANDYTLSVDYINQIDRENIGTPDGFTVTVGGTKLGYNDVLESQSDAITATLSADLTVSRGTLNYSSNILKLTATSDNSRVLIPVTVDTGVYKYMAITYRASGIATNKIFTTSTSGGQDGYSDSNQSGFSACYIGDNAWHTNIYTLDLLAPYFAYTNRTLAGVRIPGTPGGGTLEIASITFYKKPPTIWSVDSTTNSNGGLNTQGDKLFSTAITVGDTINVVSAQQSDYTFAMDLKAAYLVFTKPNSTNWTSAEYTAYGLSGAKYFDYNGVSTVGIDVSSYIKNHTFDMSGLGLTMPNANVKVVFVVDYVNYEVTVNTVTVGDSALSSTTVKNNAGTASSAFTNQGTITITSSNNDGIVGRYGSTVKLAVSGIASGKKFIGWYEKSADQAGSLYGKLISTAATLELSNNLHKHMNVVAVFASSTASNSTFNFTNMSGQILQTFVVAQNGYLDLSAVTATPFKTGHAFSGWEYLKHANKSNPTTVTCNSKTYYQVNGTSNAAYPAPYSVLYTDKACTKPAYIKATGSGATVNISGTFTKISASNVTVKITSGGVFTGTTSTTSKTVSYNTSVSVTANGSGTFSGWIDTSRPSTRAVGSGYYKSGSSYYPYISYSKTYAFKATDNFTLQAVYGDTNAGAPNVSITAQIQRADTGSYYRYTFQGLFTVTPDADYTILEWGTLAYAASGSAVPTTTSGGVTTNVLTMDTPDVMSSSNSGDEKNAAGQYAASVNVASAKTFYVRMYLRYSYVAASGETVYVVTYSDTYKFTSPAYASAGNAYITATKWDATDLDADNFGGSLF